jgi:hypothetical protein
VSLLSGRFGCVLVIVLCLKRVLCFLVMIGVVRVFMFIAQTAAGSLHSLLILNG